MGISKCCSGKSMGLGCPTDFDSTPALVHDDLASESVKWGNAEGLKGTMCVLCLMHSVVLIDEVIRGQKLEPGRVLNLPLPFTISETLGKLRIP